MALQSMTLLQNKNNVLPLSKSIKKIAVLGPNADNEQMLWGNYNGKPVRTISILNGIKSKLGADAVFYDKASDLVDDKVTNSYFSKSSFEGKKGFKATYWNNAERNGDAVITQQIENPFKLTTAGQHEFASGVKLEGFSAEYKTVFEADKTEEIVFKFAATGHFELLVNGVSLAKYDNWRNAAVADSFQSRSGQKIRNRNSLRSIEQLAGKSGIRFRTRNRHRFYESHRTTQRNRTVIFVGGLSGLLEGEEMPVSFPASKAATAPKSNCPPFSANCSKLKAAGKKVIFVNCSGSAIALVPETQSSDAILQAWYGGESGGQAVADVLFGDYNPSANFP